MTRKQYDKLEKYEKHFATAINGNYNRAIPSNGLKEMDEVYQEVFKVKSRFPSGCGHCVLMELKKLGAEYFKYKNKKVVKEPEPKDENN